MQPIPITLLIYHHDQLELKVTMKANDSVEDLIYNVRSKLARRFENIIGLASREGFFTLDFALQQPTAKLAGIRDNQKLKLVFEEVVADDGGPTLADFRFLACLGEGASAAVFLVRHVGSGQLFALKQMKKENIREFKNFEGMLR